MMDDNGDEPKKVGSQRFDLSEATDKETGLTDSSISLYPVDGYGNTDLVRQIIKIVQINVKDVSETPARIF